MPRTSTLTVVIPRILEPTEHADGGSLLAQLAGRGDVARRWQSTTPEDARREPWQRGLLCMLQLDERNFPSAPTCARGDRLDDACGDWLHADAVHLAAGLNEVALVSLPTHLALSREERDELTPVLERHLGDDGFVLRPAKDGGWLIGTRDALEVSTVTASFAQKHEWNVALPQGRDAGTVRRLMTELQMLLHEHPVNEARAARGLPAVNSLWLWGSGTVQATTPPVTPACMGDHAFLRGLCAVNDWQLPVVPTSADEVVAAVAKSSSVLFIATTHPLEVLESQWLGAFVAALKSDRFDRLEIVLDEWLLTIDRWRLRRFWRRALPVSDWSAA